MQQERGKNDGTPSPRLATPWIPLITFVNSVGMGGRVGLVQSFIFKELGCGSLQQMGNRCFLWEFPAFEKKRVTYGHQVKLKLCNYPLVTMNKQDNYILRNSVNTGDMLIYKLAHFSTLISFKLPDWLLVNNHIRMVFRYGNKLFTFFS